MGAAFGLLGLLISVAIMLYLLVGTGYLGAVSKSNTQMRSQVNVMAGNDPTGTMKAIDSIHTRVDRTGGKPKLFANEIMAGGPMAERYDLKPGDQIVEIGGLEFGPNIDSRDAADDWLATAYARGQPIEVVRDGQRISLPTAEYVKQKAERDKAAAAAAAATGAPAPTPTPAASGGGRCFLAHEGARQHPLDARAVTRRARLHAWRAVVVGTLLGDAAFAVSGRGVLPIVATALLVAMAALLATTPSDAIRLPRARSERIIAIGFAIVALLASRGHATGIALAIGGTALACVGLVACRRARISAWWIAIALWQPALLTLIARAV